MYVIALAQDCGANGTILWTRHEPSGSIKCGKFLAKPRIYYIIGNDSAYVLQMHSKCPAPETLWYSSGKFQARRDDANMYLLTVHK
jgi:hypothetical protein